jgi:hypothetical protein
MKAHLDKLVGVVSSRPGAGALAGSAGPDHGSQPAGTEAASGVRFGRRCRNTTLRPPCCNSTRKPAPPDAAPPSAAAQNPKCEALRTYGPPLLPNPGIFGGVSLMCVPHTNER